MPGPQGTSFLLIGIIGSLLSLMCKLVTVFLCLNDSYVRVKHSSENGQVMDEKCGKDVQKGWRTFVQQHQIAKKQWVTQDFCTELYIHLDWQHFCKK